MRNDNTMLHMKLNSAVCLTALLAFLPSSAYAGICFLPDCQDSDLVYGEINMNINEDTEYCEKEGYTYYSSGECPQYYAKIGTCSRDDHYLKCDAAQWCKDNGYNTTSCSIPQYVDEQCPNRQPYYKQCKTDNDRACKELGYTKNCPSGQKLYQNSGRCAYDSSYGTCCSPSGCPSYTSTSYSSYGTNGTDGCEYTCYYTCDMDCPSGTSTSNPGGCGGSTRNGCGTKTCYYPYEACCYPYSSETGCSCGTYSCSDGCGGTRKCCSSCPDPEPEPEPSNPCADVSCPVAVNCSYGCAGYSSSSNCCSSVCISCEAAPPEDDDEEDTGGNETNPDCDVTSKSCSYGCASTNSCGKCIECKDNPDCSVTSLSCTYGCASTNSCGKCTECKSDPCANITCSSAVNCGSGYQCSNYSSATSCCPRVCTSCSPCSKPAGLSCPSMPGFSTSMNSTSGSISEGPNTIILATSCGITYYCTVSPL